VAQGAQASHQIGLVIFGLLVSVPIIIWGSTIVLKLIDRYPLVVTFGAALLGWIAGGMFVTDIFIEKNFGEVSTTVKIAAEIFGALLVVGIGRWMAARHLAKAQTGA